MIEKGVREGDRGRERLWEGKRGNCYSPPLPPLPGSPILVTHYNVEVDRNWHEAKTFDFLSLAAISFVPVNPKL